MKVELSERAHQRIQELVDDGVYESAEAAVDAAVHLLDAPGRAPTAAEIASAAERGRASFASGQFRDGDEFAGELRDRLNSKSA